MKFNTLLVTVAAASMFVFAGCTVDKTEEGSLPDVDISTEGETNLPKYDVDAADIDAGMTTKTVNVPTVDVNMPPENNATPVPAPVQ